MEENVSEACREKGLLVRKIKSYEYIGHSIYEEGNMVDKQDGDDMTGNNQ